MFLGGKDFGDKLGNMLKYTAQFIEQNKDSVDQEEINKFKWVILLISFITGTELLHK